MTISPFAEKNVLNAALGYHGMGVSLIPCTGKRPAIRSWSQYQLIQPERNEIVSWFAHSGHQSIGLICGAVSQHLVVIDLDKEDATRTFYDHYPQLIGYTLTIATGSGRGRHLYFFVDELPPNRNVRIGNGGIEIRASNCYVIAPPSVHPETSLPYVAHGFRPIKRVPHLRGMVEWLDAVRDELSAETVTNAKPAQNIESDVWKRNYLVRVVGDEIARVTQASQGSRNRSLYYAALRLANFCAGGELSRHDMEARLLTAARSVRIPPLEAQRTIESAFRTGWKYPKTVPPPRKETS